MQDERKRILDLVEKGTITAQEAIVLLEKLEQSSTQSMENQHQDSLDNTNTQSKYEQTQSNTKETNQQSQSYSQTNDEQYSWQEQGQSSKQYQSSKGIDETFFEDLKRDFTQFSSKFVDLMNTAVTKVKEFDFDKSFIDPNVFEKEEIIETTDFSNISIDIPNGNVEVKPSIDGTARAVYKARPSFVKISDDLEKEFRDHFVCKNDNGTLRVISTTKKIRVDVTLYIPQTNYNTVTIHQFNGGFSTGNINIEKLKVKTMNGRIDCKSFNFRRVDLETANGAIEVRDVAGDELEAETVNGRIYVDGAISEIEAESANGHVVVTTRSQEAKSIKAQTVAGTVEIYIPSTVSLQGEVSSNLGKMDVRLPDIQRLNEQSQFLQKSVQFSKKIEDASTLVIDGETKTGSVIVRYNL
ncbi:DUF4097 family beta strand repeat-containing protein [Rummeliibacillus pycnus]|uniref:DUF4097 family beta strand repeat-containing protein n=1 Tax=Rummeliibacillus pycnus TaxID=101070 RepID=UPI0037C87F35